MAEHPAVARAYEAFARFNEQDFDGLQDYYDEDIVWHVGGKHELAGTYRGRDELFAYFNSVRHMTGGSLRIEPESVVASDRYLAAFTRVTGHSDDKPIDVVLAQVFKVGTHWELDGVLGGGRRPGRPRRLLVERSSHERTTGVTDDPNITSVPTAFSQRGPSPKLTSS